MNRRHVKKSNEALIEFLRAVDQFYVPIAKAGQQPMQPVRQGNSPLFVSPVLPGEAGIPIPAGRPERQAKEPKSEPDDGFRKAITTAAREARYSIDRKALLKEEYAKEARNKQRREQWCMEADRARGLGLTTPPEPEYETVDTALLIRHENFNSHQRQL